MPRHNRRDEPHRYTVQVQKAAYPTLERLLRTGRLVPLERPAHEPDDHIKGVASRNTYRLAPGSEIDIVQDQAILIDGQTVHASAYRLPTWAYAALRQQSSSFLQYTGMDELLARLRDPASSPANIYRRLEQAVATGRVTDACRAAPTSSTVTDVCWLRDETLLHQTPTGHWFMTFAFTVRSLLPTAPQQQATDIGLDLGWTKLTVACHANGTVKTFRPTPLVIPQGRLSPGAADLLDTLTYASGRLDAERVIDHVLRHGRHVFAERLTHRNVTPQFRYRGRDHALHDYHFAWLPQALNTARRRFTRVNPAYTSQTCAQCGHRDAANRRGEAFECTKCRARADADVNAAHVILLSGRGELPRAG